MHDPPVNDKPHIRYVCRQEIDTLKWDRCIDQSFNGLIYAYSFYLDNMASQWDALILGDYEAVMPLTWRKKWGIRYLYQPPFTQQLGVFSAEDLSEESIDRFLQEVRKYFNFAEIFLNHGNYYPGLLARTNYIMTLKAPYEDLRLAYNNHLERNLKKAGKYNFRYTKDFDAGKAIQLFQAEYGHRIGKVRQSDYDRFEKLCKYAQERSGILLRAIFGEEDKLMAVALLGVSGKRMYLLMPTTPPEGRKTGANHFLIDSLIREFAGQDRILDFEGADIPGIASFYRSFGSMDQPYYFYRLNQLPWPLKWLK